MIIRYYAVFFLFFFSSILHSQLAFNDSSQNNAALAATAVFAQALQGNKEIYNGPEHIGYPSSIEGLPYFGFKEWQTGAVQYYDLVYLNEALQYDVVKDKLVVRRQDGFAIELRSDRVDWFSLAGHQFVYVNAQTTADLKPGFYDQLAAGDLTVLVKHAKHFEDRTEETQIHRVLVDETAYYAVQNNKAYVIRNLHSLLALTGKKSAAIRQQLSHAGIKFKKNREAALAFAARYYNQTQP